MKIIIIILLLLIIVGVVLATQVFKFGGTKTPAKEEVKTEEPVKNNEPVKTPETPSKPAESPKDSTPPLRGNLLPATILPAGTAQTIISLTTNEPAACRYATYAGSSFDSMSKKFSPNEAKLYHVALVSGLTDNMIYDYFVRCQDMSGNKNSTDARIRFGIEAAPYSQPPYTPDENDKAPPSRLNPYPTKNLPVGVVSTTMGLWTNEQATCKYSTTAGMDYDAMEGHFSETNSISHTAAITWLSQGNYYVYYVRCVDRQGNKNTSDLVIGFGVSAPSDITPPVRSNPSHTGNILEPDTTSVVISISTDEPATCRYATSPKSYSSMGSTLSYYDGTHRFHVATIGNLQRGGGYDFFTRCQDAAGNANTDDVLISFRIKQ